MIEKNSSDEKTTTARRVKMARTLAGISRKDLEDKYGISMHTLQSWELGRNSLTEKAASKLVEVFHSVGISCSIEWLLKGSGKSPSILDSQYTPYPPMDKDIAPLLGRENAIQKEIDFFKLNNPNAFVRSRIARSAAFSQSTQKKCCKVFISVWLRLLGT